MRTTYIYNWELVKRERVFLEKQYTNNNFEDYRLIDNFKMNDDSLDNILNQLDNEELYKTIYSENEKTLEIIYLKIIGYTIKEISEIVNLTKNSIRQRFYKLRKK